MKKNSGFTLTELMVTLVIIGIVAVIGGPSLKTIIQGSQVVASSNELVSGLHAARSKAIRLNKKVTICSSTNGTSCSQAVKWQNGWIVFVDANGDRAGTGVVCSKLADIKTDCLLRAHEAVDAVDKRLSITGTLDSNSQSIKWFTFTSRGLPKDAGSPRSGSFSVCSYDPSNNIVGSRAVILSVPGRVRISDNAAVISCPAAP